MSTISEKELAYWEALAKNATYGPWRCFSRERDDEGGYAEFPAIGVCTAGSDDDALGGDFICFTAFNPEGGPEPVNDEANAEFIAEARTAVPALCAALRAVPRWTPVSEGCSGDQYVYVLMPDNTVEMALCAEYFDEERFADRPNEPVLGFHWCQFDHFGYAVLMQVQPTHYWPAPTAPSPPSVVPLPRTKVTDPIQRMTMTSA